MKLIMEEVRVDTDESGQPRQMRWRKRLYHFSQVLEQWQHNGEWWLTPDLGGAQRRYCRVTATHIQMKTPSDEPLSMEIYEEAGQWVLSRLLD
jgi:hypothetical protein